MSFRKTELLFALMVSLWLSFGFVAGLWILSGQWTITGNRALQIIITAAATATIAPWGLLLMQLIERDTDLWLLLRNSYVILLCLYLAFHGLNLLIPVEPVALTAIFFGFTYLASYLIATSED